MLREVAEKINKVRINFKTAIKFKLKNNRVSKKPV